MVQQKGRKGIVEAINRPLGFYVLALLIVEAFLVAAMGLGPSEVLSTALWLGVGMFVFVIIVVSLIVLLRPENMALSEKSYQERFKIDRNAKLESVSVKANDAIDRPGDGLAGERTTTGDQG